MRWTVVAVDEADIALTSIWVNDADKAAITRASNWIEKELRNDPDKKGEDFYGDRIIQYGPLAVAYELRPDDRLVRIIKVIRIKE